jgi:hypothetical protein
VLELGDNTSVFRSLPERAAEDVWSLPAPPFLDEGGHPKLCLLLDIIVEQL